MEHTLSAVADPARAMSMVEKALGPTPDQASPQMPTPEAPPDTFVRLLMGILEPDTGDLVMEAEVRELNGLDEEILARVPLDQPGRFFATVLKQGVVRVGAQKATTAVLDNVLMGDRDLLLMAIRRVTWGDQVEMGVYCPTCEQAFEYGFSLTDDVPLKKLDNPRERTFMVEISKGRLAEVHLPDGHTQNALLGLGLTANRGQLNTVLLESCIDAIDGLAVMGAHPVQQLSMRDRTKLLTEINERNFGPQLGEVSVSCQQCGEKNPAPMSLGTLFLL